METDGLAGLRQETHRACSACDKASAISPFLAPPPNLVSDAPLLQTGTQTSTLVDPANTAESAPPEENKKKLVCIDGWLILLAIGQLLGPLKFLIWFAQCWLEYFILRDHLLHVAFVLRKIEINSIVFRLRVGLRRFCISRSTR
jgi:hypothetical protein